MAGAESQVCRAKESQVCKKRLHLQPPSTAGGTQTHRRREMAGGGSRLCLYSISAEEKQGTET